MNVSLLGCGRWGSFIAWYLDKTGHNVYTWGLENDEIFQNLQRERKNDYVQFSDNIVITPDLTKAVNHAEVMIISISSQALSSFMENLTKENLDGKTIVLCMKGIEETTGRRLSEIVSDYVDTSKTPVAVWVGPGHPQDFVRGIPNCMVIDSDNQEVKEKLVHSFSSELIRFYFGQDLIGTEVGAAAKNVVGIAAGMLDGMGYTSLKGALMARGTREISRLIKAMGGNEMSAYGLCHLGDYEATLFSKFSHNRRFGEMLINGEKFDKLAEGVSTTRALVKLSQRYNVDLPIVNAVNQVITYNKDPKETLSSLFLRSIKDEF
ncbi:NAD(P)H-dependent glycerol-3-phosphate dehydrogenase [Oscillospiraceae bacterium LCP25S3_E10]|nr:NAD(P)H-dependent glycerol-3-phosphate dehydrogenase [Ruminococcus sp.]MDD6446297.1 NAD(P)H-dependent glycerol-3-phosphate dehydrogenase [Ruminococcus sp.]MDY2855810.1 NAD(P)H-dependent glycerol-3-phosphate dehydrogenase [Oscillospiraceae bacterium]